MLEISLNGLATDHSRMLDGVASFDTCWRKIAVGPHFVSESSGAVDDSRLM